MTPTGVRELVEHGHQVLVQKGAYAGSSIPESEYTAQGAEIVANREDVFERADMIVKVKEPQLEEIDLMRKGQLLFTYLHLAAYPKVAQGLVDQGVVGIAYETVELEDRSLPLLAPMSEVAGRMASHVGAFYLQKAGGGRGILLGGVSGVMPAKVVVIGAGSAGLNAALMAMGMQSRVVVVDKDIQKLREIDNAYLGHILTLSSNRLTLEQEVLDADVVIGAVLVTGASAPRLVTEDHVRAMKPGAVMVDVSIDQGGCFETSKETTHEDPVYTVHDVIHYAVGNMPGAVPHTSTYALTNATMPYVVALADRGVRGAIARHPELEGGLNVVCGHTVHEAVADSLDLPYTPATEAMEEGGVC